MTNSLTKAHAIVFVIILMVFTILTCLITNAGVDKGAEHNLRVLQTTVGTITGPLTGAISRGFQSCCLQFSLKVMVCCAPLLLLGIVVQFIRLPQATAINAMRMVLWILGWLVWFLGGLFSFLHALS